MTRIALISDIHANEVALRAVLAEIRRTGVGGRIPTILSHAEYAMIEEFHGAIGVSLRRLLLEQGQAPPGSE